MLVKGSCFVKPLSVIGCCRLGTIAASDGALKLTWTRDESTLPEVRRRAEEEAAAAAVSNADSIRALHYNRTECYGHYVPNATAAYVILVSAAVISKVRISQLALRRL
jgi:hypothetical protein